MIPRRATNFLRALTVVAVTGCGPAWPGAGSANVAPPSGPEGEVVLAAEALFAAMESRDTAAVRALFTPDARITSIGIADGSQPRVQSRGVSDFVASIARGTERLRERMWNPEVEVEGDFASLWAPYDFYLGEQFSHCGVDALHLVRTGGRWRFAALSYTVQPTSCPTPPTPR